MAANNNPGMGGFFRNTRSTSQPGDGTIMAGCVGITNGLTLTSCHGLRKFAM